MKHDHWDYFWFSLAALVAIAFIVVFAAEAIVDDIYGRIEVLERTPVAEEGR